jgi:hypothetical protein
MGEPSGLLQRTFDMARVAGGQIPISEVISVFLKGLGLCPEAIHIQHASTQ